MKPLTERIFDAEVRSSKWLADGNEYAEAGKTAMAEKCYDKGQFWLDRANLLSGLGEKSPPKK